MQSPISYIYTKNVLYPSDLAQTILLAGLPLLRVDTDGSGESMQVSIWFSDILSENAITNLDSIVDSYINANASASTLAAIVNALNTDANVIILLRAKINMDLPKMPIQTVKSICSLLGIAFS